MFAVDSATAAAAAATEQRESPVVPTSLLSSSAYTCTAGQRVLRSLVWLMPPVCVSGIRPSNRDDAAAAVAWTTPNQVALLLTLLNERYLQMAYLYVSVALPLGFACVVYHLVRELCVYVQPRRLLTFLGAARLRVETGRKSQERLL
ncbi:hypothetical protein ABB37_08418 [Leptomonas pyrrhocoris]|uniref:Uncharacterized protein n=1 Tax=Leptomonas pyrrhocoris TaxID=157538 RepID=A0A0M9FTG1_LEPPY|nr:hypothetical protein ABB37_08418 [Leptomonas pyrrhocoris]KPA75526.1 hypothetical protein ABB37_08418 [Leptomonas pyrrhocoris]|eukprot:XP_015653965.1 hypothetical protein ABB37_08418 [Leptomonas pyrrhocoris]